MCCAYACIPVHQELGAEQSEPVEFAVQFGFRVLGKWFTAPAPALLQEDKQTTPQDSDGDVPSSPPRWMCTVMGLAAYSAYVFRVRARWADQGWGGWSAKSAPISTRWREGDRTTKAWATAIQWKPCTAVCSADSSAFEDAQAGPGIAPEPKPEPEPEPEPEAVPKTESPTRRSRLSSASFLPSALRWPGTLPPAGSADNPFEHQEHLASLGDTPPEGTDKPSMEAAADTEATTDVKTAKASRLSQLLSLTGRSTTKESPADNAAVAQTSPEAVSEADADAASAAVAPPTKGWLSGVGAALPSIGWHSGATNESTSSEAQPNDSSAVEAEGKEETEAELQAEAEETAAAEGSVRLGSVKAGLRECEDIEVTWRLKPPTTPAAPPPQALEFEVQYGFRVRGGWTTATGVQVCVEGEDHETTPEAAESPSPTQLTDSSDSAAAAPPTALEPVDASTLADDIFARAMARASGAKAEQPPAQQAPPGPTALGDQIKKLTQKALRSSSSEDEPDAAVHASKLEQQPEAGPEPEPEPEQKTAGWLSGVSATLPSIGWSRSAQKAVGEAATNEDTCDQEAAATEGSPIAAAEGAYCSRRFMARVRHSPARPRSLMSPHLICIQYPDAVLCAPARVSTLN
jgi:hypothetical protein